MKKMASNSEINLEKFMENPEFKEKLFGLIKETYSKSKLTESEDELGKTGSAITKNYKRQSVGNRGRRSYKRRKITNQPSPKKDDVDEDIKLILEDEGTKKKIASYVDECIHLKDDSAGSSEEKVVHTTTQDAIILTSNIRRIGAEEVGVPNHTVDMIKPCSRPPKSLKSIRKSLRQHELKFHVVNENTSEIPLDKEIGSYIEDPGAGVVVNSETKNDLPKKDDAILLDSIKTSNSELISTETTSVTDKNVSFEEPTDSNIHEEQSTLEQPNDLNTDEEQPMLEQLQDLNTDGNMSDVSQSDDFFYLNMARENQMSLSNVEIEASDVTNITPDVLNISNINNLSLTTEPSATTPEAEEQIIEPVINSNKKVHEQSKIIQNRVIIPKLKNVIKLKCLGSKSTQSAPNFQTIIVLTQNGEKSFNMLQPVEVLKPIELPTIKSSIKKEVQPLKIPVNNAIHSFEVPFKLQSKTKKLKFIGSSGGAKPVIKSNELVNVQFIRTSESGINDSISSDISDNKTNDLDSTDSSSLPKIENVISCAEGLPIITSVTSCAESAPIITNVMSCATSSPNIENTSTCAPSLHNNEDIISLAERISPNLITPSEKILKIKRKVTRGRGRKKFQSISMQRAENLESEVEKNSDSLNSSASTDVVIEETVTGDEVMHNVQSVAPEEKNSEEDVVLHINGLNVKNSPRKGLKVLKPVKRVDCVNSEIGDITVAAMESVDRSGLPSIQNVVSLAKNNVFDECLEEANLKLANGNGIYTANITDEKFKVLQPRDDDFKSSDEFVETWDDILSENGHFEDNFDYCVDSLIEDMSGKKPIKKSPYKNHKSSPPFSSRHFGASNDRNKGLRVLKPVIRKQRKRGKRKAIFTRRKIRRNYPNVKENIQNNKYDADVASINFADLSLVDTESTFVQNKYNNISFGQSAPNIADIPQSRISPMKALRIGKYFYDNDTDDVETEQNEVRNEHITEPTNNSEAAVENAADFSMEAPDEELLEEVPLQQRRCNNFYVKVPTGEELGSNINLEEYEKFFSIQDENDPTKIRKPEIESLHDDEEDLPGTPGKRRTKCSKCDKTFIHSVNRKIHEETCENNVPQKSECSKCGRWFAKTAYRKIHEKKCQVMNGTIEIPITPLNDILRCAMCPFTTGHKTAYINHLKSHMYNHKKNTTSSAKIAAQRRKFGYRKRRRKYRFGPSKTRCEVCNDDAGGVEHMVSRCRRCGAFNLQWCDECHQGGYSTACRLRHHEAQCSATPHTRCNDVPRVRVKRLGPPLPLHCVSCDVTRILYIREKRCKQCSSQLLFKCEMCDELRDTFAELCGHVARVHIIGCLVQCNDCGKNCEDMSLHRRTCECQRREEGGEEEHEEHEEHEEESNAASSTHELMYFSEDDENNDDTTNLGLDNLILELDEDSNENHEQIIEEI